MGVHHASVFLHEAYQKEVDNLVKQVDQQDYEPLRERACEAVVRLSQEWPLSDPGHTRYKNGVSQNVLTQEWPLFEHGGESSLPTEDEIRDQSSPTSDDLGQWFIFVLAEYIRPCPSPLGNWSVIYATLQTLGWKRSECDLLFRGLPTSTLLKPKIGTESPWPLKHSHPYWLWLHPGDARAGWLRIKEIDRLHKKLGKMARKIETFDVHRLPDIDTDNPVVVRDYEQYLSSGYQDTVAMLSTAREQEQGLFLSITLPDLTLKKRARRA